MRISCDDPLWVVVNPTERSELCDVLFQASLRDLELQFKGGLTVASNPTLFTDRNEAELEAHGRLLARDAARAITAKAAEDRGLNDARRLQVLDGKGRVLLAADLT